MRPQFQSQLGEAGSVDGEGETALAAGADPAFREGLELVMRLTDDRIGARDLPAVTRRRILLEQNDEPVARGNPYGRAAIVAPKDVVSHDSQGTPSDQAPKGDQR